MRRSPSFHAHHAPMGSHSSFTVGMFGGGGGMAMEQGSPAGTGVFIGYRDAADVFHYLPFFREIENDAERFCQADSPKGRDTIVFGESEVSRDYLWATDRFRAPGVEFEISTPFFSIPDVTSADAAAVKFACCPATFLTLTIANSSRARWEGFFALETGHHWTALSNVAPRGPSGFMSRDRMGFATFDAVEEFCDFSVKNALKRGHATPRFLLGPVAGIRFEVPAGETREVHIVLGYYHGGQATFNRATRYWYTRHFNSLPEVFTFALENRERYLREASARDAESQASGRSEAQQFLIAHATRSYYGSTEWLADGDDPVWVVNEGEYLMMNTLDLTVDMLFFELRFNPWTVRNVLEHFADRYQYEDELFAPDRPDRLYPGGVSFTHDMGVGNHFSPPSHSSYECAGIDRACFSYMTCEQLTNWVLCAGVYVARTGDETFARKHRERLKQCLESLLRRDHPDPERRNGLMGFESSRTRGGGEITTYDSLDHSLGQARNNVYLAGKCWASYLALEALLGRLGDEEGRTQSRQAAQRCAEALEQAFDDALGFIPAVLGQGSRIAILPAAEALVYPWEMGLRDAVSISGPYGGYVGALKRHVHNILKPGVCLYPDGGWKLSSSADNSWMSKICLNQYVVRHILGLRYDGEDRADDEHVRWEVEGSKAQACSDQFASGKPIGSRYYPRIVTSILWLDESGTGAGSVHATHEARAELALSAEPGHS